MRNRGPNPNSVSKMISWNLKAAQFRCRNAQRIPPTHYCMSRRSVAILTIKYASMYLVYIYSHITVFLFQVANTCPVPCWWIWSPEPWIPSDPDLSDRSSGLTTLCLARAVPATTGPRATTPRALSSSTPCSMWFEKKRRTVTVFRASRWHIPSVVAPALAWAPCSSARSGKSTPTESWTHSQLSLHQRCVKFSIDLALPI